MTYQSTCGYYIHTERNQVLVKMWRENLAQYGLKRERIQLVQNSKLGLLKKLKIELPYGPDIPLLSIYLKELKLKSGKDICTIMLVTAVFTKAKRQKQLRHLFKTQWHVLVGFIQPQTRAK